MKLLFDHNVSPRLVQRLADLAPDSTHVALVGLEAADDRVVWQFAADHGYTIVTKDTDFNDLVVLLGTPPKIIWLRLGNCTTQHIEQILRATWNELSTFVDDPNAGLLLVPAPPEP
jgi:predicted nuclease of predicted toxin-antitoxin system